MELAEAHRAFRVRLVNIRPKSNVEESLACDDKRDVLDDLAIYMRCAKALQNVDPIAYHLHNEVGSFMSSPKSAFIPRTLGFLRERYPILQVSDLPSFMSQVNIDLSDAAERMHLFFLSWLKVENKLLPEIEAVRSDETMLALTLVFADQRKIAGGAALLDPHMARNAKDMTVAGEMVYVAIANDFSSVRELRVKTQVRQAMIGKYGADRGAYSVPRVEWRRSHYLSHAEKNGHTDALELLISWLTVAGLRKGGLEAQVRARSGAHSVCFNIRNGEAKRFFRDRDRVVNVNGNTKRIFHVVPSYVRSDGVVVAAHTKGLQQFDWNGFSIHVGIAGVDFPDVREFKAGVKICGPRLEWGDGIEGHISVESTAEKMRSAMLSGMNRASRRKALRKMWQ